MKSLRKVSHWFSIVHGLEPKLLLAVLGAWVATVILARVGIAKIDPSAEVTARPLETLGTISVCLPVAIQASLLSDRTSWLTAVSPRRRAGLRLVWYAAVFCSGGLVAVPWGFTLPSGVPIVHSMALWSLLMGFAAISVSLFGKDFAVLAPVVLMAALSVAKICPFKFNIIYNLSLTQELEGAAVLSILASALLYVQLDEGAGLRTYSGSAN